MEREGGPAAGAILGANTHAAGDSAIRFHPIGEALALELVPEVADAPRDWFGDANLDVLQDPRARLRSEDARSYVAVTHDRFDVVVGDLVVPWRRGESSLYTRESFDVVSRVLAPGGLYCQWVPPPRTTVWRLAVGAIARLPGRFRRPC